MRQLAQAFPANADPNLLAGLQTPDDAAVYRIAERVALIQTADFFTPIVDDPHTFGAIAAANAMSDVYAMGGEVLFALNVAGLPEGLPTAVLSAILEGGAAKVREAGGHVAGGHTVTNPELFYGLSVTGKADPDALFRKGGVQAGDHLFLSKPLGTGLITTAQIVETHAVQDPRDVAAATDSMLRLNAAAARVARRCGVGAATDVTGFGLLGHAAEMAAGSAAGMRLEAARVPCLPHVQDYVENGVATRAGRSNREHFGARVKVEATVASWLAAALWEAETSGGLLLAVPPAQATRFSRACAEEDVPHWYIGEGVDAPGLQVV